MEQGSEDPGNDEPGPERDSAPDSPDRPDRAARLRQRRRRGVRQTIEWVILIGGALLVALIVKTFLFQAFYIPSDSMVPTLKRHDRVLVNKLSYKLHAVHRGDIVVFKKPPKESLDIKDLVKRVVGLPGETVEAHDNHVYVNGKQLKESYLPVGTVQRAFSPQTVPRDSIWVMGDNREGSEDSRVFGPIKKSSIVGRVFVRIWPLNRLHFF
ncbi:MAG: signal peptidase [Actinomycetia bacterium]|nr:signal peptidase [Actinomycetes bacterium]